MYPYSEYPAMKHEQQMNKSYPIKLSKRSKTKIIPAIGFHLYNAHEGKNWSMMLETRMVVTVRKEKRRCGRWEKHKDTHNALFLDLSSGHVSVRFVMFIKLYTYFLYISLYNLIFNLKNVVERAPSDSWDLWLKYKALSPLG